MKGQITSQILVKSDFEQPECFYADFQDINPGESRGTMYPTNGAGLPLELSLPCSCIFSKFLKFLLRKMTDVFTGIRNTSVENDYFLQEHANLSQKTTNLSAKMLVAVLVSYTLRRA